MGTIFLVLSATGVGFRTLDFDVGLMVQPDGGVALLAL